MVARTFLATPDVEAVGPAIVAQSVQLGVDTVPTPVISTRDSSRRTLLSFTAPGGYQLGLWHAWGQLGPLVHVRTMQLLLPR